MGLIKGFFIVIGDILKWLLYAYTKTFVFISGIFGIDSHFGMIVVAGLYTLFLSVIYDLIASYCCKFSKKYRNLETEEERKEYCSRHMHFLLKDILNCKNFISKEYSKFISFKNKLLSKMKKGNASSDELVNTNVIVNNPVKSNNLNEQKNNDLQSVSNTNAVSNTTINSNNKSNIKVIYSSNMIGNMLRNNVVLERKFLNSDKPVLIDFANKPKEVFTGHLCDSESGIKFRKMINGKKIEIAFDKPEFINDTRLYDELNLDELKQLRELLLNDNNYQKSLHTFFNINDKALKLKKI